MSTIDVITGIQEALASPENMDAQRLGQLAEGYAHACSELNRRVYKCHELLRDGHRAKARGLAKQPPDLRDEFARINFGSIDTWLDICESHDLAVPVLLDVVEMQEIIEELYYGSDDLDQLLRRHRRLALAKGPLGMRLKILRKIAELDRSREVWNEDIRSFETAYIEELSRKAKQAAGNADLDTLEQALAELRSSAWQTKPPSGLIKVVEKLAKPHRQTAADRQYKAIQEDLRRAHAAMDEAACRKLVDQWRSVREKTGCEPSPELAEEIAPVEAWLGELTEAHEEDRAFEQACRSLEKALDSQKGISRLEKLAAAVLRSDRGMPEVLAARFSSRMEELQRVAKRNFALKLVGILCLVAVVAGGVAASIVWYRKAQELSRWQDQISARLDEKDTTAAKTLLDKCAAERPEVYASPEVQGLLVRYREVLDKEKRLGADFLAAMASARRAGLDDPDEFALLNATRLARTHQEKKEVQEWREKIQKRKEEKAAARRKELEKSLLQIEEAYQKAVKALRADEAGAEKLADDCTLQARQLASTSDASSAQKARAKVIARDIEEIREKRRAGAAQQVAIRGALDRIKPKYADPAGLKKELQSFASKYPGHPMADEFLQAVKLAPHWQAAADWGNIAASWHGRLRVTDSKVAKERLGKVEAYFEQYPAGPKSESAKDYLTYLKAAAAGLDGRELKNLSGIEKNLSDWLFTSLDAIRTKKGRVYYLPKDRGSNPIKLQKVNFKVVGIKFTHIIDYEGKTKLATLKAKDVAGDITKLPEPAPQARFAKEASKLIGTFTSDKGKGWESFYLKLAELARTHKDMDPILRARLIRLFLVGAEECCSWLPDYVKRESKRLQAKYLDDVDWLDPDDSDANRVRSEMASILAKMVSFSRAIESVQERANTMVKSVEYYHPVGMILGERGKVVISDPSISGSVYVMVPEGKTASTYREIGTVVKGVPRVDSAAASSAPCGSVVFVKKQK